MLRTHQRTKLERKRLVEREANAVTKQLHGVGGYIAAHTAADEHCNPALATAAVQLHHIGVYGAIDDKV